jgi:3-methyladenine DNA glycosylase AlkD
VAAMRTERKSQHSVDDVEFAVDWLKRHGTASARQGMARYAIPSDKAFGVPMREVQALAKQLGRQHSLALALWRTGWYEARLLAAYVDDPSKVIPAQMDRWSRGFENWAVCDTVCFALFDRTPYAWQKVDEWAVNRDEYVKRAAFALIWGLSVHDKSAGDEAFLRGLRLIQGAAADPRYYVGKGVSMALRATGKRNATLRKAALSVANRLAKSTDERERSVGKEAIRDLSRP